METFEDNQLLAQRKDLERQVAPVFEERDKCREECQKEFDHSSKCRLRQRQKSNPYNNLEFWRRTAKLKVISNFQEGQCSAYRVNVEPSDGPPLHIHPRQTELFLVLEGEYEFAVGERRFRAGPGDVALVPPGTPHAFRNAGTTTARLVFMLTPALGGEVYFRGLTDLADRVCAILRS